MQCAHAVPLQKKGEAAIRKATPCRQQTAKEVRLFSPMAMMLCYAVICSELSYKWTYSAVHNRPFDCPLGALLIDLYAK